MPSQKEIEFFECKLKRNFSNRFDYKNYIERRFHYNVYCVYDHNANEERVIKEPIHPHSEDNLEFLFNVLNGKKHPNVVQVHEMIYMDNTRHLLEEYIDGFSLREIIHFNYNSKYKHNPLTQQPLSWENCVDYTIQACNGIIFFHDLDQCLRDINPSNLMISKNNELKIVDFSCISIVPHKKAPISTGATFLYSAPELLKKKKRFDQRVDLYPIGVMLYEMLSGELLFKKGTYKQIMKNKSSKKYINNIDNLQNVPDKLNHIIKKTIQPKPNDRYRDVRELRENLISLL